MPATVSVNKTTSSVTVVKPVSNTVSGVTAPRTHVQTVEGTRNLVVDERSNDSVDVSLPIYIGPPGPAGDSYHSEHSPMLTYDGLGTLERVDFASGAYKLFTYGIVSGVTRLIQVDFVRTGEYTVRKGFTYSNGLLVSVIESQV